MNYLRTGKLVLIVVALALVLVACGGGEEAAPAPAATVAPTRPATAAQPTAVPQAATAVPQQPTAAPRPTTVPPPTATPRPVSSGTMTVALGGFGDFSMIKYGGGQGEYVSPIYDFVIGVDADRNLSAKHGFATSWEVADKGTLFTIKFREGVPFHNGTIADAADVRHMLELARDGKPVGWSRTPNLANELVSADTPDRQTLVYRIRPSASNIFWHIDNFSELGAGGGTNMLTSKSYIETAGFTEANKKPIGTGPYKFVSAQVNENLRLEAVENHFLLGVPKAKTILFRSVPEETTRTALLRSGEVDLTPISRASVKPLQTAGMTVFSKDGTLTVNIRVDPAFAANLESGPNPMYDVRVRQALVHYGIDRQTLADTFLQGGKASVDFPSAPGDLTFKAHAVPAYDVARAKALLTAAGYPNGFEMDYLMWNDRAGLPEDKEIEEAIAVMWEKIGIKVKRIPYSYTQWRSDLAAKKYKYTNADGSPGGGGVAYRRPTAAGVWALANSTIAGARQTAFWTHSSIDLMVLDNDGNYGARLSALSKEWAASENLAQYSERREKFSVLNIECGGCTGAGMGLVTIGPIYAGGKRIAKDWDMGVYGYGSNYENAAALSFTP